MLSASQKNKGETTEPERLSVLKQFNEPSRKGWERVPEKDWQDWRWQIRHRLRSLQELAEFSGCKDLLGEQSVVSEDWKLFPVSLTPYLTTLIDWENPRDPVGIQFIPSRQESHILPIESLDPCSEEPYTVVPGLVHRYPDRVLLLASNHCPAYCRHCTRSRLVGADELLHSAEMCCGDAIQTQLDYIRAHTKIRDVLVSGGDPLLLSDHKLEGLLMNLRSISHVEILRIGTRVPITLPQRVTEECVSMLQKFHPLYVNIQCNHPNELTLVSRAALERLANAGIPLGNQSVLLRGVNDDPTVMTALVQKLLICRVRPYYLYQCDLVCGTSHLRVPAEEGVRLIGALRGFTSGFAVPEFVIDVPGGGKIPFTHETMIGESGDQLLLKNYEGKQVTYPRSAVELNP